MINNRSALSHAQATYRLIHRFNLLLFFLSSEKPRRELKNTRLVDICNTIKLTPTEALYLAARVNGSSCDLLLCRFFKQASNINLSSRLISKGLSVFKVVNPLFI